MKPLISVIMPSLNVKQYIDECLESVQRQTLDNIEIICIDAGSTDGTLEKIKKRSEEDNRILSINSPIKSYGYQVNLGIEYANGDYLAIVETDDYISEDMFECLYNRAEQFNLEMVKADFKSFVEDGDEKIFCEHKMFKDEESSLYNQVIVPRKYPEILNMDANLWKGIYKKNFLDENNIRCQETSGASYQDIGFTMQVLSLANRAMYIPEQFYRYRMDRDEASSKKPSVLQFVFNEFKWLVEKKNIKKTKGFFLRMTTCYFAELNSVLELVSYDTSSDFIRDGYLWLSKEIKKLIEEGIIQPVDYEATTWDGIMLSLYNLQGYAQKRKEEFVDEKEKEARLLRNVVEGDSIVVFGAGVLGKKVVRVLKSNCKAVVAVCDNNIERWGKQLSGVEISSPDNVVSIYSEAKYIIANKKHFQEIEMQLVEKGIHDIYIYR